MLYAGALSCETHQMRLQALPRAGAVMFAVPLLHRLHKVLNQLAVPAPMMIAGCVLRVNAQNSRSLIQKWLYGNDIRLHIAGQLPHRSHYFNRSMAVSCKGSHHKACHNRIFELHGHSLMIYHIITAMVDTPAVWAILERPQNAYTAVVCGEHVHKAIFSSARVLQIKSRSIIRAPLCGRAAVKAMQRRALWRILRLEMC